MIVMAPGMVADEAKGLVLEGMAGSRSGAEADELSPMLSAACHHIADRKRHRVAAVRLGLDK